jgi:thioesterase domain-containing protein
MRPTDLESYLHEHIPLSSAMGVTVVRIDFDGVVLAAPLGPNINHRDTVFGGSASALAILAGWSLVYARLADAGLACRIVIQRNSVEYDAPMLGEFTARSSLTDAGSWPRFLLTIERRGRARLTVSCVLESEGLECASFEGTFVAIDVGRQGSDPDRS